MVKPVDSLPAFGFDSGLPPTMKIVAACILLFLLCTAPFAVADQPAPTFRHVTTSQGQRCYFFKMIPEKVRYENNSLVKEKDAWGVAYKLDENGEIVELWRTEGWYASEVFLSDDGRYLVRMGVWPTTNDEFTDVAVAFYDRGKLLKSYDVRDLIKRPHLIEHSVSHYRWQPRKQTVPNGIGRGHSQGWFGGNYLQGEHFHLVMIDKTAYHFDLATGDILSTETDPGAQSELEFWIALRAEEKERGEGLYRTWPLRADFEKHFTTSEVRTGDWYVNGVWLDGANWEGNLAPKKDYGWDCLVEAVFPISKKGDIEVTITPQEIDEAFSNALRHPFVEARFKDGATGIRLRITGDRLHWNTPELEKWLKQTRGAAPKEAELRYWAYAIIDEKEQSLANLHLSFTSFYLNTKTGELLYEDESAPFPYPTVLLDAKGTRIASSSDRGRTE